MKNAGLSLKQQRTLLKELSSTVSASVTPLQNLIRKRKIPSALSWRPELCITHGKMCILVHPLVAAEFPKYLEAALAQLNEPRFKNTHVLLLARDAITEASDESPPKRMPAPFVALQVAEKALALGCALAFESDGRVYKVFEARHHLRRRGPSRKETGHIPKWLYTGVAGLEAFSPHLKGSLKAFEAEYARATTRISITNDREADILLKLAKRIARGEPRLYLPLEQLVVLKAYEMSRANTRARDHFFHTFNNLLLGFLVLGKLYGHQEYTSDVDQFISTNNPSVKLLRWEALWFLTCAFHDPAYMAENFWGTFRFTYGVEQDQAAEDEEIPDSVKRAISDMWDGKFLGARRDLYDLYNRAVRRWVPPTLRQSGSNSFDNAIQKAYFDGTPVSHSLVSGLRLVNQCRAHNVPRPSSYDPAMALIACEIAALSMMFHDPRCRAILSANGIQPIPFERLPYASLLMFVDALQDDRRDISISQFRSRGILRDVHVSAEPRFVKAVADLRETSVKGWAPRIAEYESVMGWINQSSSVKFLIEYRTEAGL